MLSVLGEHLQQEVFLRPRRRGCSRCSGLVSLPSILSLPLLPRMPRRMPLQACLLGRQVPSLEVPYRHSDVLCDRLALPPPLPWQQRLPRAGTAPSPGWTAGPRHEADRALAFLVGLRRLGLLQMGHKKCLALLPRPLIPRLPRGLLGLLGPPLGLHLRQCRRSPLCASRIRPRLLSGIGLGPCRGEGALYPARDPAARKGTGVRYGGGWSGGWGGGWGGEKARELLVQQGVSAFLLEQR